MSHDELAARVRVLEGALDAVMGQVADYDVYGEEEMRERMRQIRHVARAALAGTSERS